MKKLLLLIILSVGIWHLPSLEAQQLKAISFNIGSNYNPKQDGKNAWSLRQKAVLKMLKTEEPDIFAVQEVLLDQMSVIDKQFWNKYRRVGAGRDNGLTRGEHTAIYYDKSRFKLLSSKTRWLSPTPQRVSTGWDAPEPHIVTMAHLLDKETGRDLYYFNTHIEKEGTLAHTESVILIAKLIASEVPADTPVILSGDMQSAINTEEFDPLYNLSMDSGRDIANRTDYRNTYNAYGGKNGAMNDHFFVRNISIERFKTIIKNYGVPYISDHYPIMIIFNY